MRNLLVIVFLLLSPSVLAIDMSSYSDDLVCDKAIDENGNWTNEKDLSEFIQEAMVRNLDCKKIEKKYKLEGYTPSYKPEYSNKSSCDPTISSWCKEQLNKSSKTKTTKVIEEKKEIKKTNKPPEKKEDLGFWGKTDLFLGKIADGLSKEDMITGLRTVDSPFHNEKHYRKQGEKTLNFILNKARKDKVKIFSETDPQFIRVKNIVDRLVDASHYRNHKDKVKYAVIDYEDFNALAFGGGYFVVFSGLMNQTNDDELAYVIAHELAHNTAGHIEESHFLKMKDAVGKKPSEGYAKSFTNINEQEADRIAIIYTALAGYDPRASSTIWAKRPSSIQDYAFYRTHPPNTQRSKANSLATNKILKYYTRGVVNPNVEKVLKCNALFCNRSLADLSKDGSGGGVLKTIEVIGDILLKNQKIKEEKKKQEKQIAQSKAIMKKQRLETPPKVNWQQGQWNVWKGSIYRHNQKSGLNFGLTANAQQGQFFYNFNNKIEQGFLNFRSQNQYGYWYSWKDKWGSGLVKLKEFTDGSLRGSIYMYDGTDPGKLIGEFVGYK